MSDWLQDYQVGSFIDSRDTMNTWCMGQILEINHESKYLKIHYDGWSDKWDKRFSFSSGLIAPFRKKSELYTGQKGIAIRDFIFSKTVLLSAEEKMTNLPASAFGITQFLRGELFTLVDCLLVNEYKSSEDFSQAMNFLLKTIRFLVEWLKTYKIHFSALQENENFSENTKTALAASWPELLFTLKRLFGQDPRTQKQLQAWTWVPENYLFDSKTIEKASTLSCFINHFGKLEGFSTILEILKESEERLKVPFKFLYSLPVFNISAFLSTNFGETWIQNFRTLMLSRIQQISEKEIKNLDKELVSQLLEAIHEAGQEEELISYELSLNLKLLNCPYLEKQLKGLVDIKEIIENFNKSEENAKFSTVSQSKLADWIVENRILQTVLEKSHEEMVKRTSSFFIFLFKNRKLDEETLSMLWTHSQGRHDSLQQATFQVISDISESLDENLQKFLWKKFTSTNPDDFSVSFLKTFKNLSLSSGTLCKSSLKFLYQLVLDSSKCKTLQLIYDSFESLLISCKSQQKWMKYLKRSLNNISKMESVCQSMNLINTLLKQLSQNALKSLFIKTIFESEPEIIQLLVESFKQLSEPHMSSFPLSKHLNVRLRFWKNLTLETVSINTSQINQLSELVTSQSTTEASNKFFKSLLKLVRSHFSPETNSKLLETLFLEKPFESVYLDDMSFAVFHELFLRVNNHCQNLEVNFQVFISRKKKHLAGFDFLISCIFKAQGKNVVNKAIDLLVKLNLKLADPLFESREEVWEDLFRTLRNFLQQSEDSTEKALQVLWQFLSYNLKKTESFSGSSTVYFKQGNEDFNRVQVSSSGTLKEARAKIAERFKQEPKFVLLSPSHMQSHREKLDLQYDDLPLSLFNPPAFLVEILSSPLNSSDPEAFFSKREEFQEFLMAMLPKLKSAAAEIAWSVLSKFNLIEKYVNRKPNAEISHMYLEFFDMLRNRPAETSCKLQDQTLIGILEVLTVIVARSTDADFKDLAKVVLHSCLFDIPTEQNRFAPKCKHQTTRRRAFELLKEMCLRSAKIRKMVIKYLSPQVQDPSWRTSKLSDWNNHPTANEKSETGFVGMKNLGCICYMICALQQLFHVTEFRESILSLPLTFANDGNNAKNKPGEENLLFQIQRVFSALKYSEKKSVNPSGICRTLKDSEGRSVNILQQMDVDEFINTFMDWFEGQLKATCSSDLVKDLFSGLLANEIIGQKGCSHKSEVNEAFITLPVQVKGKKSLLESLESFKEGETLEGPNAYQCDYCDNKVTALRRVCIKYLPNILFISLRRFEFDYDTMRRLKINDYCEFPMELNMQDFTQEGIERLELLKEKETAFAAGKEFRKTIPELKFEQEYYQFALRGVIIHIGSADGGHYYSFIKEKGEWFEFNDTVVRKIDPNDIPVEAFGGEERLAAQSATGNASVLKSRIRNAYILIYERKKRFRYIKEEDSLKEAEFNFDPDLPALEEVMEGNKKYWRCKSSFSSEFFEFINSFAVNKEENCQKFVISFFLTVMIRSRDFSSIATCVRVIKDHLRDNKVLSDWLLEMTGFKWTMKELLMDCPNTEKRRLVVGLIHSALKQVTRDIRELFFKRLLSYLDLARKPHSSNFSQYFELIFKMLKLDVSLIKKYSIHSRVVQYLKEIPQGDLNINAIPFQYSDIFLGYDRFEVVEKPEVTAGTASMVFLVASLNLAVSELTQEQINFLFDEKTLNLFLNDGYSRFGGRVLGQFYSTLCKDSKELSFKYGAFLINGIDRTNHDKHKTFMRQLVWLFSVNDAVVSERNDFLMVKFLKQLQDNKRYPMATESSFDFLLKISFKFQTVRDWLVRKRGDYKWVHSVLTDPASRGVKHKDQIRAFEVRTEACKKLFKGKVVKDDFEDSDQEPLAENLPPGTRLEYQEHSNSGWTPCSVVSSEGSLIHLSLEPDLQRRWVDNLSDHVRPR